MFQSPTRIKVQNEDGYCLKLQNPVQIRVEPDTIDATTIRAFAECRQHILRALVDSTNLFRTKPTLAALDAICPPWGYCTTSTGFTWSKYSLTSCEFGSSYKGPIHYTLSEVHLSRSFIIPYFNISQANSIIDLAFGDNEDELQEVEDVPSVDGAVELADPVKRAREKKETKQHVRELFRLAQDAADEWMEKYGLSDDESAFSDESDETDERNFVTRR